MNTLDRKIQPAFKSVEKIEFIIAAEQQLQNRIPVYTINAGTQELIKIEFVFSAGGYCQQVPYQATTVNAMLDSGTSKLTADEIADSIDFYGAFLETDITNDHASVVLYTLNKHLKSTLPIVEQIIKDSTFPQHEIETYIANRKQDYYVDIQKVAYLARRKFVELLFGNNHPYGINPGEKEFDMLTQNQLQDFYSQYYSSNNCKIILAGKVNEDVYPMLDKHFGGDDWTKEKFSGSQTSQIETATNKQELIFKQDALQSAIRIGKILFNKTHPDFHPMLVLNTVFGGYFGSRLMANIREDKGYTYGIGSGITSMQYGGYFYISTEVGVDVTQKALNEIYSEMKIIREKLIEDEELQLVKNYMLGTFLRSVDGPFAMAERFKGAMQYNLTYDYYNNYIATIKGISASHLRDLANQYFIENSMTELVVGKKN